MRSTRNSISAILLFVVAAFPGQAPAIVEAVSKAITPSETTPVFHGMYGTSKSETLPPTYMDVSSSGRYVLYRSMATNILPGFVDEPGGDDLFLFDRVLRQTTLVTHHPGSSVPINKGAAGQMSEDGSTVLFSADESNGTAAPSVYMFDRASGSTRLIGRTPSVPPGPLSWAVSADGSWSAIVISDSAGVDRNLFLYERASAALHPVPNPPGCVMQAPEISADGLTVLFERQCPGGEPGVYEVVLYERLSGVETVVRTEAIKGALSRDGRFVLFGSHRSDVLPGLVDPNGSRPDLYRYDKLTQETILVNRGASPLTTWTGPGVDVRSARISDDGSVVALTMDSSGATEPFVFKASTGAVAKAQTQPAPLSLFSKGIALSGDGRTMAYTGTYHIFVVDVPTMVSRAVTATSFPGVLPNAESLEPVLSRDGSFVVFASRASNLGIGIRDFDGGWYGHQTFTAYGVELGLDRVEPISIAGSPSQVQFLDAERLLVSGDGRRVTFGTLSNAASTPDATLSATVPILRDRSTDVATRLGGVGAPLALSEDGSTTVVIRDHGHCDAYRDGVIVGTSPVSGTTASADGSKIAGMNDVEGFTSVVVSLWDVASGQTTRVSRSASTGGVPNGDSERPEISRDGLFVAFESRAGDLLPGAAFTGLQANVYLYDVANDSVQLVSRTSASVPPVGETRLGPGRVLSRDGRYLAMTTKASSLGGLSLPAGGSHIVLYDRVLNVFALVGGPEPSDLPNAGLASMDAAGRFIVFRRYGQMGNTFTSSLFVFDRQSGLSEEIVARLSGDQPRDVGVEISADGSTIAFSRLVTDSSPSAPASAQAYVFDRRTRRTSLASHGATGADPGNGHSMVAALDSTGDVLVFRSSSSNLGVDLGFTVGGQQHERGSRQDGAFAFLAPPIVYGVSPVCASTSGGRTVTIEGAHFKPGSTVTLDGIPATVTNVTSTAITVVTGPRAPTKARTGHVEVRSPNGEYDLLGNAFTYAIRGDANNSGALTAADGFYLKMALFLGGPQPATLCNGDANGSGATTAADAFFLNLYLFLGGASPPP